MWVRVPRQRHARRARRSVLLCSPIRDGMSAVQVARPGAPGESSAQAGVAPLSEEKLACARDHADSPFSALMTPRLIATIKALRAELERVTAEHDEAHETIEPRSRLRSWRSGDTVRTWIGA